MCGLMPATTDTPADGITAGKTGVEKNVKYETPV